MTMTAKQLTLDFEITAAVTTAERDQYEHTGIEVYTVGDQQLWRVAGLRPMVDGRFKSLECNIMPWEYPAPGHNRQPLVVACGMGTDSIAMLVEMHRRGIRPDCIQFADTGSERRHTYRYIPVLQAWLKKVGFPPLLIVRRRCPKAGHRSLYEQAWRTKQLPAAAFHTNHSCSIEWKLKPQRNWQKRCPWLADATSRTAIGFDADEAPKRKGVKEAVGFDADEAGKGRKSLRYTIEKDAGFVVWLPLAEWGMSRADCIARIVAAGLPEPGKSACFMCPVSSLCELAAMKQEEPANLDASLALETRYRDGHNFRDGRVQGLRGKETWAESIGKQDKHQRVGLVAGELPEPVITEPKVDPATGQVIEPAPEDAATVAA